MRNRYFSIIMPVHSDKFFFEKKRIIENLTQSSKTHPFFPSYDSRDPEFDLELVKNGFRKAKFVLADLSNERPSCYFELGVAEAVNQNIILIAQKGTEIHQCSGRDSVIFFGSMGDYQNVLTAILIHQGIFGTITDK